MLLENVGEELDPILEPLLLKQTFKQGGVEVRKMEGIYNCFTPVFNSNFTIFCSCPSQYLKLGENSIEYSRDFRFYITTRLRNPHYLPEISVKVTLVNFMITPLGLEDQLLGIVAAKEKPELEEKKNQLIVESAANKKQVSRVIKRVDSNVKRS